MRRTLIFAFVIAAAWLRKLLGGSEVSFRILMMPQLAGFRKLMGEWKAYYAFVKARRDCPAYKQFLIDNPGEVVLRGWRPDFSAVVATDKPNYVKKFTLAQRCHGGELPVLGAVIDESSGSTGKPNNWVRGPEERKAVAQVMQLAFRDYVGNEKVLFINAFALGPWATGMCVSNSIVDQCLLKSTGPDIAKIITTLGDFGPGFRYVIAGYPPFLKQLVDTPDMDWSKYRIMAFYGGEGMSESMRAYLCRAFEKCFGDYGASDLEINVAAENDFTVAVRELLDSNPKLCERVNRALAAKPGCERLGNALPHVFQYNPLDYMIEANDAGELIITLCRASNVAPKIRYNIHDNGQVMSFDEFAAILAEEGIDTYSLPQGISNLPIMLLYGRSDLSVAYYGCKIPPTDMERVIFETEELATTFSSFRLITTFDDRQNKHLTVAIEMADGVSVPDATQQAALYEKIFAKLATVNQDYREASRIAALSAVVPVLEFHKFREGPFVNSDIRVKLKYVDEAANGTPAPAATK